MNGMPTQWEYLTVDLSVKGWLGGSKLNPVKLTEILNTYGRDGWELVAVLPIEDAAQTSVVAAILKRTTANY